jgi:hypothetical protein
VPELEGDGASHRVAREGNREGWNGALAPIRGIAAVLAVDPHLEAVDRKGGVVVLDVGPQQGVALASRRGGFLEGDQPLDARAADGEADR